MMTLVRVHASSIPHLTPRFGSLKGAQFPKMRASLGVEFGAVRRRTPLRILEPFLDQACLCRDCPTQTRQSGWTEDRPDWQLCASAGSVVHGRAVTGDHRNTDGLRLMMGTRTLQGGAEQEHIGFGVFL